MPNHFLRVQSSTRWDVLVTPCWSFPSFLTNIAQCKRTSFERKHSIKRRQGKSRRCPLNRGFNVHYADNLKLLGKREGEKESLVYAVRNLAVLHKEEITYGVKT